MHNGGNHGSASLQLCFAAAAGTVRIDSVLSSVVSQRTPRLTGRARQLEHGRGLDVFACAYSDGKNSI